MTQKNFIALLFFITISVVFALGSPSAQAQQNNSNATIRVIILKSFPPQFVTTADGPSGLAVEMIREVAQRASLKIEFVTLDSWKEVYEPLKNGTVDVIANMGISEARKKILEFTDPYEVFDIKIFVRTETKDIKTIDNLKGRLLGVQKTNVLTKGLVKSGDYQIRKYASFKLALLGLLSGEVDAVPAPTEPFLLIAREARLDGRIKFVGDSLLEVKRGIALPKGRTELRDRLNKSLREFKQTDDYQKLLTRWYGTDTPFWTITRLAILMGIVLTASILIMGLWRYHFIVGLSRRIQESDFILTRAQDIAQLGSWKLNIDTMDVAGSKQLLNIFDLDGDVLVLDDFAKAVHPDDQEHDLKHIQTGIEHGEPWDIEHRLLLKDGTIKWVHAIGDPLLDEEGKVSSIIGIVQDITKLKLAEEELKNYQKNLEVMVKERTAELEEKNKELEEYNELFTEREFRIKELKDRVKELEVKEGSKAERPE